MRIEDTETGRTYTTTMAGFARQCFAMDRGYGEQYALPLEYWTRAGQPVEQLALWAEVPA